MQELKLELHQQEEIPNEISLPVEEISITPVSNGRNTQGKYISSTYSSLISKGRDKITVTTSRDGQHRFGLSSVRSNVQDRQFWRWSRTGPTQE